MSELDGTRTISIPSLAFNYVNNRLESIGYQGELYVRERGIPTELDYIEGKNRWFELFGTPERAARTLYRFCAYCFCGDCATCGVPYLADYTRDYDALLEWLREDCVHHG